jgi:hypothetical protein
MEFSYAYIPAQFLSLVGAFSVPAYITADAVGLTDDILTFLIVAPESLVRDAAAAPVLSVSRFGGG